MVSERSYSDVHLHRCRNLRLERGQQAFHGVGHRDRVGPGLALDAENDRALGSVLGVEPGRGLVVLDAVDHVAKLVQSHRRAIAVRDNQGPVLRRAHQLTGGLQSEGALGSDDAAGRQVDVPARKRGLDFIDTDLPRGKQVRIHLHVNRVLLRAEHLHLGDPADHRNALCDARFCVLVQSPQR